MVISSVSFPLLLDRPATLGTAIRTSVAQVERVSTADIRQMAQTYLVDAKAWKLEVKPAGAP